MKPKKAKKIIDKIIKKSLNDSISTDSIIAELIDNEEALIRMLRVYRDEDDIRSGLETYGYTEMRGRLKLLYGIWYCRFRVQWLLGIAQHKTKAIDDNQTNN